MREVREMTTETPDQMLARVAAMTPAEMRTRLKDVRQEKRGVRQQLSALIDENLGLYHDGRDAEALANDAKKAELQAQLHALRDEDITLEDELDRL